MPSPKALSRQALSGVTDKDYRALLLTAVEQGWTASHTGNQHIRLAPPDGGRPLFVAGTSHGGRGDPNLKALLRRHGVVIDSR